MKARNRAERMPLSKPQAVNLSQGRWTITTCRDIGPGPPTGGYPQKGHVAQHGTPVFQGFRFQPRGVRFLVPSFQS